jgi:hypothetical protein
MRLEHVSEGHSCSKLGFFFAWRIVTDNDQASKSITEGVTPLFRKFRSKV